MRQSVHQLLTMLVRFSISDGIVDLGCYVLWGASTDDGQ
jgi:hypothetical protein